MTTQSIKNDGLVTMHENQLVEHHFERVGQHDFLRVATGLGHFVGALGVVDENDVLGDNGALIELFVHEMRSSPGNFHALAWAYA